MIPHFTRIFSQFNPSFYLYHSSCAHWYRPWTFHSLPIIVSCISVVSWCRLGDRNCQIRTGTIWCRGSTPRTSNWGMGTACTKSKTNGPMLCKTGSGNRIKEIHLNKINYDIMLMIITFYFVFYEYKVSKYNATNIIYSLC